MEYIQTLRVLRIVSIPFLPPYALTGICFLPRLPEKHSSRVLEDQITTRRQQVLLHLPRHSV